MHSRRSIRWQVTRSAQGGSSRPIWNGEQPALMAMTTGSVRVRPMRVMAEGYRARSTSSADTSEGRVRARDDALAGGAGPGAVAAGRLVSTQWPVPPRRAATLHGRRGGYRRPDTESRYPSSG